MIFFRLITEQYRHSRLYRLFLLLLAAGFLKQLADYAVLIDSNEYLQAAHNLLNGHWSACGTLLPCGAHWLEVTRRTPGYPLLILLTGFSPMLLIALQIIAAALVPIWSIRLLNNITKAAKAQQILMIAFLLYPLQFFYSNLLMPEIWVQWILLCTMVYLSERNFRPLPFLISALILLKPVFILLIPLSIYLLFKPHKYRLFQLLPVLFFLALSYYNFMQTGWFHYSSMAVENAYEYNMRAVMNRVNSAEETNILLRTWDGRLPGLNYAERATFMQRISREKIGGHFLLYSYLHVRGSLAALLDPGRYDLVAFLRLPEGSGFMGIKNPSYGLPPISMLVYMGIFLLWRVFLLAMVLRFLLINSDWKFLFLLFPVFFLIAAAGPVGSARYLFPAAPLIFVMAAAGFTAKRRESIV
jgi:hypothetical protein